MMFKKVLRIHIIGFLIISKIIHIQSSHHQSSHNYTLHEFRDFTGKSQITFTSQGDATFKNAISSQGGSSNFHDLIVKKNLNVRGSIYNSGHILVNGDTTSNNLKVKSNVYANSANFDGLVRLKDDLVAQSDIIVKRNVNVDKNIELSGMLSIGKFVMIGSNGNLQTKFLNSTGNIDTSGNIKCDGHIIAEKKITSKEGFFTKEGSIKAKDIEVMNSIRIVGSSSKLQAKQGEFMGKISGNELISKTATIDVIKVARGVELDKKSRLSILGELNSKGDVILMKGFKSQSHSSIDGDCSVKGLLTTENLRVGNEMRVSSIIFNTRDDKLHNNKTMFIDAKGGSIQAGDFVSTNSIQANTVTCTSIINTNGELKSKFVVVSHLIKGRELEVSQNAVLNQIDSNTIHVNKTLFVDGSTQTSSLKVSKDCSVNGLISAQNIALSDTLKTSKVFASGHIEANSLYSKINVTTDGQVHASGIKVDGAAEVGNIITTKDLNATNSISGFSIYSSRMHILEDMVSKGEMNVHGKVSLRNNVDVERNIRIGGNITINGVAKAQNLTAIDAIRSIGDLFCESDAHVIGNILAAGSIEGKSANISGSMTSLNSNVLGHFNALTAKMDGNVVVGGNMYMPQIMNATSTSIVLMKPLEIKNSHVSILNASLNVGKTIQSSELIVDEQLNARNVSAISVIIQNDLSLIGKNSRIISSGGLTSENGNITCVNVIASGWIESSTGIMAPSFETSGNAIIKGNISANRANIKNFLKVETIESTNEIYSESIYVSKSLHVDQNGKLTSNSTVYFNDDAKIGKILYAREAEFKAGVKMKAAFASRVYTEDLIASGFVTAATINSKGSLYVKGKATFGSVLAHDVEGQNLLANNSITCKTAKVDGVLESAGINVQKVYVNDDLILDGISVKESLEELRELKKHVSKLESMLQSISKSLNF